MDGNKDEALRCISIAKDEILLGNKKRALKFIKIAQRLNHSLVDHELLAACEKLDSVSQSSKENFVSARNVVEREKVEDEGVSKGEKNYTKEHVTLIREIKSKRDYYSILGVEKGCLVEEIRRAYRKLSLKVHPDKNKAPGSEEAFKKVSKAFKCLSDESSRREYDEIGLVDEVEYGQRHNVRRRRRTGHDFFDEEFEPDQIFRSFFGQTDMFRTSHVHRRREAGDHHRDDIGENGHGLMVLLQLVLFLVIVLLAFIPTSEPEYSLQKNYTHQFSKMTEEYGVDFFVKSSDFDEIYPIGTPARDKMENSVIKDYKSLLGRYCHVELQRRQWRRNFPTPNCDKLRDFGVA